MSAGLDRLNALAREPAEALLLSCCSSPAWAAAVAAGRPYADEDDLYAAADDALAALSEPEVDAALAGHPRIGERTTGAGAAHSEREQAGLAGMSRSTADELADANRRYEQRFGHVYLVCATGRSAPELLQLLWQRLDNDPQQERRVLREELRLINRIRLAQLVTA